MTADQAKAIFSHIAASHRANGEFDRAGSIDVAREYCPNPAFRKALENYSWGVTCAK